jgi:hypothetical protein
MFSKKDILESQDEFQTDMEKVDHG